ncbi:MAG: 1,2-phenylacetyl-CoA epoxidase subunit PaaD [Actinomycetota bacterium]|jgi:ring-1,2-phenylacetyl-CoA epoxidase subunit PaaD
MAGAVDVGTVRAAVAAVPDPEIPVLTIEDLGILRDLTVTGDGRVEVTLTPTYSGCPATEAIRSEVERVLAEHGFADAAVRTVLAPAWTTDWISDEGRRKLAAFGIAPPGRCGGAPVAPVELVRCPQCGSADTRLLSRFGSTACKALRVCNRCREPFDHFKPL